MRKPRVLASPGRPGLYHVCSRVVDRRVVVFGHERRKLLQLIKGGAAFAGVDVVSWCLMGNHFHLLVRVPVLDADSLADEEVLSRMAHIYTDPRMRYFRSVWENLGSPSARKEFLVPFRARMGRLSEFVKTLKQRFTQWFNARNNREGTLWEGRFHSVMLAHNESENGEGLGLLARFVAGYIDLNPVRAKVVTDSTSSTWSGYGSALRGDRDGLAGLRILWGPKAFRDLGDEGILRLHDGMLKKARFRDQSAEPAEERPGKALPLEMSRQQERDTTAEQERLRATENKADQKAKDPSGGDRLAWKVEARLLPQMGERCEALTTGQALGTRWMINLTR